MHYIILAKKQTENFHEFVIYLFVFIKRIITVMLFYIVITFY